MAYVQRVRRHDSRILMPSASFLIFVHAFWRVSLQRPPRGFTEVIERPEHESGWVRCWIGCPRAILVDSRSGYRFVEDHAKQFFPFSARFMLLDEAAARRHNLFWLRFASPLLSLCAMARVSHYGFEAQDIINGRRSRKRY